MKKFDVYYDVDGVKYKKPAYSCKKCKKYPCIENFEKIGIDFAKYGCNFYEQ